jgi:hypothetical protein
MELARLSKADRGSARWRELMRRMHLDGWSIHDLARCPGRAAFAPPGRVSWLP